MNPLTSFLVALRGLSANKLRSSLTVLGMVIGVAAVIALMSVGRGAETAITSQIEGMGTNLIFVRPGASTEGGVRGGQGSAATLTLEDAQALADPFRAPSVAMVAPEVNSFGQVVAGGNNVNTRVMGVTPDYQYVRNFPVAEGEFISDQQVAARSSVAVLGSNVAQDLFGDLSPVGQSIRISGRQFRVIGVLESKGGTGQGLQDDIVLAPLTTVQARLTMMRTVGGGRNVQTIYVQATSAGAISQAEEEIRAILRERHRLTGGDDFTLSSQEELLQARTQVTDVLTLFLGSIAGLSLLVGGIGIMNIMLVSVTERTREIGIRKAVGAKRRHILIQFLLEATMLSLSGGVAGLLAGWGAARAISGISIGGTVLQTQLAPDIMALAFSVAAGIGLFFGIYPAFRAARLNPIDALRYE